MYGNKFVLRFSDTRLRWGQVEFLSHLIYSHYHCVLFILLIFRVFHNKSHLSDIYWAKRKKSHTFSFPGTVSYITRFENELPLTMKCLEKNNKMKKKSVDDLFPAVAWAEFKKGEIMRKLFRDVLPMALANHTQRNC